MDDLIAFLNARLDDDEQVARDAAGLGATRSHWKRDAISCVEDATDGKLIVYGEGTPTSDQAEHIARHDPARVLAEVDAKRRIIADLAAERHVVVEDDCWYTCPAATEGRDGADNCNDLAGKDCNCGRDARVERRLRLLALPYVGHPDYREEWRL